MVEECFFWCLCVWASVACVCVSIISPVPTGVTEARRLRWPRSGRAARSGGGRWGTARAARFALRNWYVVGRGGWLRPQWGRSGAGGGVACWGARWRRNGGGRGGALARRGDADPNLWCQRGGRGRGAVGRASGSRQAGLEGCHDGRCGTCGCCRDAAEKRAARRRAVALLCSVIARGRGSGRRVCGGPGGGWGRGCGTARRRSGRVDSIGRVCVCICMCMCLCLGL